MGKDNEHPPGTENPRDRTDGDQEAEEAPHDDRFVPNPPGIDERLRAGGLVRDSPYN